MSSGRDKRKAIKKRKAKEGPWKKPSKATVKRIAEKLDRMLNAATPV